MVNGTLSRITYYAAVAIVLVVLIAEMTGWLLGQSTPLPDDAKTALTGALMFLWGAHVKPPIVTDANGARLAESQKAVPDGS